MKWPRRTLPPAIAHLVLVRCNAAFPFSFWTDCSCAHRNDNLAVTQHQSHGGRCNRVLDGRLGGRDLARPSSPGSSWACASPSTEFGMEAGSARYARRHLRSATFHRDLISCPGHYVFASGAANTGHLTMRWSERPAALVPYLP